MSDNYKKRMYSLFLLTSLIFLTAMSTSDYTRKVDPLPDMPKGNPDPSLGIVIHPNSTAIGVLSDSSQAIRFRGTKNYSKTYIEQLSSSSMRDYSPKKFKFIDEKHGFTHSRPLYRPVLKTVLHKGMILVMFVFLRNML